MRANILIATVALAALTLPAIAQQVAQPAPAPTPAEPATTGTEPAATATPVRRSAPAGAAETGVQELTLQLPPAPPPIEYPAHARRDPWSVGLVDPGQHGLGTSPWRAASGAFLSTLMRRMQTPIASRWAHMAMRDALIAKTRAPRDVHPVDWVAERAWLLLRMGEADAARMLIAGVDTDKFTPKMTQVAVQSALANSDPPALCPIEGRINRHEPRVRALVEAICASLGGEPESAAAQIDQARRFGRIGGIDLVLAEKVVGAGANTGRAVTVEWEPVEYLTSWRYGLATATGMTLPERLMQSASPQLHAFYARAPLLTPENRLDSAHIAAGLGVLSSQSLIDLYSAIYDSTDPSDLPQTDAWQLRQAFVGRDAETRLAAIRKVLGNESDPLEREAKRALVARAAALVRPDANLESDAPTLISAMLAAGYDRQAARWANAVQQMDDENGDRAWAMLALAAPNAQGIDISYGRITSFIGRDQSRRKQRSALLVAGLAGLGRINEEAAVQLDNRYGLRLGRANSWTRMIRAAARMNQPGTVLVMTGTGLQGQTWDRLPASHLYRALQALTRTGQEYNARMIAAEALSRT